MSFNDLKEVCNKIVGTWYCDEISECFTFHLNTDIFQTESTLTVINKNNKFKPFDIHYGIGIYLGDGIGEKTKFYIDINKYNKRYYKIEEISKDILKLREYWMIPETPPSQTVLVYRRLTDLSAADEILKDLDLGE